jgi:hypothetical protein
MLEIPESFCYRTRTTRKTVRVGLLVFPDSAAVAQLTVNQLVASSNLAQGATALFFAVQSHPKNPIKTLICLGFAS